MSKNYFFLFLEILKMSYQVRTKKILSAVSAAVALAFAVNASAAVDVEAAKALARQNGCFKCHSVDKEKDGPMYSKVAAKYRGKADAEQRLMTHITSGEKAKFPDGHEEDHKNIKGKASPEEIKNLVDWILSL
jgi:cytochrome c